jgi:hypothetical protein
MLAQDNPVPVDAFSASWSEPRWQAELGKILASPGPKASVTPGMARLRWPRLRSPRRRWRLAGLGAIAAAAAAAAFAVASLPPAAPPRGPAPGLFRWPSGIPGAEPGGAGTARSVLLSVASTVARQPAVPPGRYWRSELEFGDFEPAGSPMGEPYMIVERGHDVDWEARGDSDPSSVINQWLGVQLPSRADAAAWRHDGSPTTWAMPPDVGSTDPEGFSSGNGGPTRAAPGKPTVEFAGTGPSSLTYAGKPLSELPPDPAVLRRLLGQNYQRSHEGGGISAWLFSNAQDLLTDPVTPAVRSAVYRVLAALPGAVNLGTVRDVAGQSGTGIALVSRYPRCLLSAGLRDQPESFSTAPCTVQQRLIINPSTGLPLAYELRYVSPPGQERWAVAGGLFSYELFQGSGWTDQTPPTP